MIRIQDIGEITYGGAVTVTEWWDNKRIDKGEITRKDILRKASFWTYLGIGLPATMMSAFGWWGKTERWTERLSHGFLYGFPGFIVNLVQSLGTESRGSAAGDRAVKEAQEVLSRMRTKELASGSGEATHRSYQHEFESVAPHAF